MSDPNYFSSIFEKLANDMDRASDFPTRRLLLAHYTSLAGLQGIVAHREVWFTHPLAMNDHEEMAFGMNAGSEAFRSHMGLFDACGSHARYKLLQEAFESSLQTFWDHQAFDTYLFCAGEHEVDDTSGRLSMWRGYGGNGSGAAIVFDTAKFGHIPDSPLLVGKVRYLTRDARIAWLHQRLDVLAEALQEGPPPDDQLQLAAVAFLERLKLAAIFSKDIGFDEEMEWRIVYLPDRDHKGLLKDMLGYTIGTRGIEPRLKLKISPIPGLFASDLSLESIVDRIILGPSQTSVLALPTVRRMLAQEGAPSLAGRLFASRTPYRS